MIGLSPRLTGGVEFGGRDSPTQPRGVWSSGFILAVPDLWPKGVRLTRPSQDRTTSETSHLVSCPGAAIHMQRSMLLTSEIFKLNPPAKVAGFKLSRHTALLKVHMPALYALTIDCPLAAVV